MQWDHHGHYLGQTGHFTDFVWFLWKENFIFLCVHYHVGLTGDERVIECARRVLMILKRHLARDLGSVAKMVRITTLIQQLRCRRVYRHVARWGESISCLLRLFLFFFKQIWLAKFRLQICFFSIVITIIELRLLVVRFCVLSMVTKKLGLFTGLLQINNRLFFRLIVDYHIGWVFLSSVCGDQLLLDYAFAPLLLLLLLLLIKVLEKTIASFQFFC